MSKRTSKTTNIHKNRELAEARKMAQRDFSSARDTLIKLVIRGMSDAFECLKVLLILPQIMENREELDRMVFGTRFEPAIRLVDDYFQRRDTIIKSHRSPLGDHGMVQIIDFFQRSQGMYKLFPGFMAKLSLQERQLLRAFEILIRMSEEHLQEDAEKRIENENRLQKLYRENVSIVEDIEQMKCKLNAQEVKIRWKKYIKLAVEDKTNREINARTQFKENFIQHEKERIRSKVNDDVKKTLEKQARLTEDLENLKMERLGVDKMRKKQEKNARDEKNKLQLQLEAIIKKYDSTIGEKMIEMMNLKDKYAEDSKKLKEFMVLYRKEAALYNIIVVKREKEEERIRQEKILKYMMNRAARQIQRYWKKWKKHLTKKNKKTMKRMNNMMAKVF